MSDGELFEYRISAELDGKPKDYYAFARSKSDIAQVGYVSLTYGTVKRVEFTGRHSVDGQIR